MAQPTNAQIGDDRSWRSQHLKFTLMLQAPDWGLEPVDGLERMSRRIVVCRASEVSSRLYFGESEDTPEQTR